MKRLGLTLGRHASCEFLAFDVDHAYTLLMGSSVGLRLIQETNWLPFQVEFNLRPLGLSSFIAYKVQTIMMGSSVGLRLIMVQATAKHMHNAMQLTWTDLKVGSMGHYNMGRR